MVDHAVITNFKHDMIAIWLTSEDGEQAAPIAPVTSMAAKYITTDRKSVV